MNSRIMIIVSGEKLDEKRAQSAFSAIPGLKLHPAKQSRGIVQGAVKAAKWIGDFVGESSKVADLLIEQATKEFAGASIEVQVQGITIKVSNVNRSQIIELLDRAAEIAEKSKNM